MGRRLYQDVADAGGLEVLLRGACPGGTVKVEAFPGCFRADVVKGDRAVSVTLSRRSREFTVRHSLRGAWLSYVTTADLAQFIGSVAMWLDGATARELVATCPFADFVAVADAFESGDELEFRWQKSRASNMHGLGDCVAAVMREPRLRPLYPFTSHWWMSFRVAPTAYRMGGPWVRAVGGGRFSVADDRLWDHDVDYDAAEAARVCVAELERLGVLSPPACP